MIGEFDDISPRSFLNAQFDPLLRQRWDITCKEMQTEGDPWLKEVSRCQAMQINGLTAVLSGSDFD